jgi:translation initiation factor 2 beta subunit (eIF-2beta)/eIF-5
MKKILFELAEKGLLENLDIDNLDEVLRVIIKRRIKTYPLQNKIRFYDHVYSTIGQPSFSDQIFTTIKREFSQSSELEWLSLSTLKDKISILNRSVKVAIARLIRNTIISLPKEEDIRHLYIHIMNFYFLLQEQDMEADSNVVLSIRNNFTEAVLVCENYDITTTSEPFDISFELIDELLDIPSNMGSHVFISNLCDIAVEI